MTEEEMRWKAHALSREIALTEFVRRLLSTPVIAAELPRIGLEMRARGAMRHAAQDPGMPHDLKEAFNNIANLLEGRISN
jgi:hypothetical protein